MLIEIQKSYCMVVGKSEDSLFYLGTLKFGVLQEWNDEIGWFFAYWYQSNLGKLEVTLIIIGVAYSKMDEA